MPVLGEELGKYAAALHEAHGVGLRLSSGVARIEGLDHIEAVVLTDGEVLPAERVLVATGSLPNTEWLTGAGLRLVAGAVSCDSRCAVVLEDGTSRPDIVVAGDVAAWPHPHADGESVSIEHWTNARDMAVVAAANLLGGVEELTSVPTFWSDQYNVKIKSAGYLRAANHISVVSQDPERASLVAEAHRDGEFIGAVVFNANKVILGYLRKLKAS